MILSWDEIEADDARHPGHGQQPDLARVRPSDRHARSQHQRHAALGDRGRAAAMARVMTAEFDSCGPTWRRAVPRWLAPYGAENEAEFFARGRPSASSTRPVELQAEHPGLYASVSRLLSPGPAADRLRGRDRSNLVATQRNRNVAITAQSLIALRRSTPTPGLATRTTARGLVQIISPQRQLLQAGRPPGLRPVSPRRHVLGSVRPGKSDPAGKRAGDRHRGRVVRNQHFRLRLARRSTR